MCPVRGNLEYFIIGIGTLFMTHLTNHLIIRMNPVYNGLRCVEASNGMVNSVNTVTSDCSLRRNLICVFHYSNTVCLSLYV